MAFTLTIDGAKSVIRASEGREPGPGHTLERHVNITRENLYRRTETVVTRGEALFFAAFIDLNDCAQALCDTLIALAADPFIDGFDRQPDGAERNFQRIAIPRSFRVRYGAGAGIMPAHNSFSLALVRMSGRPHSAHIITFYPAFPEL
ncbi:hypothetical protein [Terrarubrum flagellatum]|uniref:hypothetical protein n=1 Tax=Terrirubrum flagellatum TaxID=2895980 RepID=UPI0031456B62